MGFWYLLHFQVMMTQSSTNLQTSQIISCLHAHIMDVYKDSDQMMTFSPTGYLFIWLGTLY